MSEPSGQRTTPPKRRYFRTALRVACIALIVWAGVQLVEIGTGALADAGKAPDPSIMRAAFWGLTALYALALAIPFVPGVEIGLSMMMVRGADAALPVYCATVSGLMLAYLMGRYIREDTLARWSADLGLGRVASWIDQMAKCDRDERLNILRSQLPRFLRLLLVDYRYVALGVLLNVPGNALIGGGGGILLIAGFSRLFDTRLILLMLVIAVAPVPILFMIFDVPWAP